MANMVTTVVKEVTLEKANDLLQAVSPRGDFLCNGEFIYRGHSCTTYKLVPSVLRDNQFIDLDRNLDPSKKYSMQVKIEKELIRRFFNTSDKHGLPIPEDSQSFRTTLFENDETWPKSEHLSLIALAQHYGIPTRLLDWSRNRLTALHFAAESLVRKLAATKDEGQRKDILKGSLSLWALAIHQRCYADGYESLLPSIDALNDKKYDIRLVTAPNASNSNLNAQDGVFTLYHKLEDSEEATLTTIREPLDGFLSEYAGGPLVLQNSSPLLYHFQLPKSEAINLLKLLHQEHVDSAKLFPGYEGVRKAMEEIYYLKSLEKGVLAT